MFCMRLFTGSSQSSAANEAETNGSKPIRSESWEEQWGTYKN